MPVPPTSISAATITSHAMPMEMRMPVRIVGAAAGRMMVKARRKVPTSSVRATLSHSCGIGGEIDLLGHRLVVDIALDLSPPLHLGKDPDGERWPRERIEIDAVGVALHVAEPVGIGAGEDLLEHG